MQHSRCSLSLSFAQFRCISTRRQHNGRYQVVRQMVGMRLCVAASGSLAEFRSPFSLCFSLSLSFSALLFLFLHLHRSFDAVEVKDVSLQVCFCEWEKKEQRIHRTQSSFSLPLHNVELFSQCLCYLLGVCVFVCVLLFLLLSLSCFAIPLRITFKCAAACTSLTALVAGTSSASASRSAPLLSASSTGLCLQNHAPSTPFFFFCRSTWLAGL